MTHEILEFGTHARIDMPKDCKCRECNILLTLVNGNKKWSKYDYAFCVDDNNFHLAFTSAHTRRKHVITIQNGANIPWDEFDIFSHTKVLLVGSYYNVDNIKQLYDRTSCVTHYTDDRTKFPNAKSFPTLSTDAMWTPSWLYFMHRSTTSSATFEDRAFIVGMEYNFHNVSWDVIVRRDIDEYDMIQDGSAILHHTLQKVRHIIRDQSRDIQCGPYKARLVVNPGFSYNDAVANDAACDGYDIGITMNYDKDGCTQILMHSEKSFVDLSEWGNVDPKGNVRLIYPRIISYDPDMTSFEELIK